MKKVLLTGIAGFIASEVARQLGQAGVQVVGVDNLNSYYDPRLKRHRLELLKNAFDFEFIEMDIEDQAAIERLIKNAGFDTVINLAARAGVGASVKDPYVYVRTNLIGTLNLLQAMVNNGVSKMVLASTSSVYAGETLPFHEEAAVNRPLSPYAASKKAAELMAHSYFHLHGLSCSVVRYFTVFGPAGRPDMSIFRFMRWIDEGRPIELFGDGHQRRDFTYVEDVARGTLLAAELPGYEIINLGGGRQPVNMLQVIEYMERSIGRKAKIDFKPALKADMPETQADIAKASRLLNWAPRTGIWEGLDRTLDWYRAHRELALSIKL